MKPSQQLTAMAVAGLCGTALSLPQVPFYTSRFPQHPQNLGYGGDYPKYWQGEAYSPPQGGASYYNPSNPSSPSAPTEPTEPAPPVVEPRPSFTDRKYPAREAIKYYGGNQFPVNEEEVDEPDSNTQNIKIKNDTPTGENDKSFMRITKSPGIGGIGRKKKAALENEEASSKKSGGLETIADAAVPEFNGVAETAEDRDREDASEPENWNSFTFGVVSDTLVYHDPYEDREGDFERKTNAMEKIELMMGREYGKKDTKNMHSRRSLGKRDWPEHIQEKALKMMDSAANMQTKGQKTIDNDPAYQESLKAKSPAPEPVAAAPKSTFPVAPKSKNPQQAPPKQAQAPPPPPPPPQPKKKVVGSGGGDLVPPGKSGKLGRAKGRAPPPQQQGPSPQPSQNQQKAPKAPSDPNQPRQPAHKQPSQQQPSGDMRKKTGNSKQPQQANFPSQDLPRKGTKGSGLNTPNQRPQNSQKKPQNGQRKPAQNNKQPQQRPQNKLRKRQVAVPAGPEYPPGTTIIRRPYVPPQPAVAIQNTQFNPCIGQICDGQLQNQGQGPSIQQISDGQIQRQYTQQAAPIPAPVPVPVPVSIQYQVPPPPPIVYQQTAPAPPPAPAPYTHQVAPAVERTETVQFAAIVHPGQVICPESKPCPQPEAEYVEKTVLQPVQRLREIPVTREAVRAVPGFEAVDVVREVDVVKEMQVEKQVIRQPVCESCEQARQPQKTITVCAECREAVGDCSCHNDREGGSYSRTFSNGKEASAYGGPGPVSGPAGLEAFFRQRMPEHFGN